MNNIQDEFISTVSHELRTPLTSIRGFSQTLLTSWDKIGDEDKKKFIKIISDQSGRLINLVENILSVSKANASTPILKQVDINSSIEKIVQMFPGINVKLNLAKNLPSAHLDDDKFQQIMTNLIDNAKKYSDEGKEINISSGISGDKIFIKVKDEGVGIKEEDFAKVFQKFSRLENHLTSKTQGNGLGLYITKQLVESMNGNISFTSEFNKGTTFEVEFSIYNPEEVLKCSQIS